MKIVIFGATGSVGKHAVSQALEQGHTVTAFVRNPSKLHLKHENLRLVTGDVLEANGQLENAIEGQDAVLVVLGAGAKGRVRSEGTANIIDAMKKQGVRKLICQSTMGAGDSEAILNFKWRWLFRLPLRFAMADHNRQEQIVRQSGLDWTIVRPASFTDGPLTGDYQEGTLQNKKLTFKISRADVAHFLLSQIQNSRWLGLDVALSY